MRVIHYFCVALFITWLDLTSQLGFPHVEMYFSPFLGGGSDCGSVTFHYSRLYSVSFQSAVGLLLKWDYWPLPLIMLPQCMCVCVYAVSTTIKIWTSEGKTKYMICSVNNIYGSFLSLSLLSPLFSEASLVCQQDERKNCYTCAKFPLRK